VTRLSSKVSLMGRHDSDPRARLRYLVVAMVALVVVVLLVVGFSTLHALT
jgi:hypothetical protein